MNTEVPEIYWYLFWVGLGSSRAPRAGRATGMSSLVEADAELWNAMGRLPRAGALNQGGVPAADIKKLRAQAGANCLMCHGK